jgi:elongation factor Ts
MEVLRLKGLKGVTKREGRTTSNGIVIARVASGKGYLIELACETDFVAKADKFVALGDQIADAIAAAGATDVDSALAAPVAGKTVADAITDEAAIMGEKVELRRIAVVADANIDAYLHRTSKDLPPQVGVLVAFSGADVETAHDVAVHIAAFSPTYLTSADVPADIVETERRIAGETARNEGKPEAALEKIVEGRVKGFFKENCLLEQDFAKDNKVSVGKVLEQHGLTVSAFVRFRVGA